MKKGVAKLHDVFCGNSQMAEAMRNYNWSNAGLGPVEDWPQPLKIAIRIVLMSSYPMFVWWGKDMIMFYNDGYLPILGPKHPGSIGKSGREQWAEIWDQIGPQLESVLEEGKTINKEKTLLYIQRNCLKEETYYTYSYSPVLDEEGKVGGIFCACHEDTPQVLSERRLKTISNISGVRTDSGVAEARRDIQRVLAENVNDFPFALLYVLDEGPLQLENYTREAFTTSLETVPELMDGTALLAGVEEEKVQLIDLPVAVSRLLKLPDHGMMPEKAAIIPVRDAGNNVIRGYLVLGLSAVLPLDEDYRKFLNLVSSQVNATAANVRAFERERLLTRKLMEVDKAKTDFFSNVSHEFRTPLTLILGPLEVLLSKADSFSEEDKTSLQIMQRNGMRLLKQVNNLLNFSYVEAGRYNARFVATDLAMFTSELAGTFRTVMQQAGLVFAVKARTLSEPIFIDRDMWELIVLNLLSNAYKFTLSGSITVELVEKEKEVELQVSDTGVGIPEQELPRLFERFHRIKQTVGRNFEGSGIGLALVAELVKLHGGRIDVISQVGQGSRFVISIPKGSLHLPQDKIQEDTDLKTRRFDFKSQFQLESESWLSSGLEAVETLVEALPQASSESLSSRPLVLVVDDNQDMLSYLVRLIEKDYRVLTASNGLQALQVLENQIPDLILSDVMMPVMDGVTLLNKLRSIPAYVSIPVILLSARAGETDKYIGLYTGADDYLVKPFSATELITRIKSHINNLKMRNAWKEKEQTLLAETEQRKEFLESILDSISDSFFHLTPDLTIVYVNNKAIKTNGVRREEQLGKKALEVYPQLEGTELYQKLLEAVETLQPQALEHCSSWLNRWFDCRIYPTPTGISVYFADITERKLEEEARRETEKRFEVMANAAPVLIWMADTNMLCFFFNDSWLHFRGRSLEEESGNGWVEGVHPDDLDYCMRVYVEAFRERKPFTMEYRLLDRNGEYRWILDNGVPRFTDTGQFLGYLGACADITAQKWAESVLSKYARELEESVALRTRELQSINELLKIEIAENQRKEQELTKSHEQLQLLTFHLQDLRESDRRLVAREIHDDLGQALTALKIEISLLYDRLAESRSKDKGAMLESLESMEQALDASLVAMRKIISRLRPSLSDDLELVYEIQKLVSDINKRLGLPIAIISEVETLELDPSIAIEVYRVIQESITNIIKHANASSAFVQITRQENRIRFLVADDGIGFDERKLSTNNSFGLLGIRERAQRIGAELAIHSGQGKGTKVELLLEAAPCKMNAL